MRGGAFDVACEECGSRAHDYCRVNDKIVAWFHASRLIAWLQKAAA